MGADDSFFSEFPDNFDLSNVTNIGVMHQEGSTYYVDDFEVIHGDRVAQSFEIQKRGYDPNYPDHVKGYAAWKWDYTDVSLVTNAGGEAPIEGDYCLKAVVDRSEDINHIGGVGLRSEVRSYDESIQYLTYNLQDLNPSQNDHFSFWVKAYPEDGILTLCDEQNDHNLGIEIFDKETHWQFEGGC